MNDKKITELGNKNGELFILCEPTNFYSSEETRKDNFLMTEFTMTQEECTKAAQEEHANLVKVFNDNDIATKLFKQPNLDAVDAIYASDPTICFKNKDFPTGVCVMCPMFWPSRRIERNQEMYKWIKENCNYEHFIDLTFFEKENKALEGRGVTLFDWKARCIYIGKTNRAHPEVVAELARRMSEISGHHYDYYIIDPWDSIKKGIPFHTVNYLAILNDVVVVNWASIKEYQHSDMKARFLKGNYKLIEINYEEMYYGGSGVVEFHNSKTKGSGLIISTSFRKVMRDKIWKELNSIFNPILLVDLSVNEKVGGCAVECLTQIIPL